MNPDFSRSLSLLRQEKGESQRKVAEATGDVQAERLHMQLEMERKAQMAQIEAEEMRLKGYNQKDVLQADVQKAYAGALGQMGANGGGASGGMLGDIASLGVTLGAMGGVINMTKDALNPIMNSASDIGSGVMNGITSNDNTWNCACGKMGIDGNFCTNCGAKKPEPVATTWDCVCGKKGIDGNFCSNCGAKCDGNFCPNCGHSSFLLRHAL